jgi:hypothetical protein
MQRRNAARLSASALPTTPGPRPASSSVLLQKALQTEKSLPKKKSIYDDPSMPIQSTGAELRPCPKNGVTSHTTPETMVNKQVDRQISWC